MRQIILDTETTGINPEAGHRIIEIGCVEMIDRRLTGKHFHFYLNPQREVDEGAFRVHGISTEFLQDKPLFKDIVEDLIRYISDAELIIHNAPFDIGFLNMELSLIKHPAPIEQYCVVTDSLALAREKHPGQRNSLDALCKRYEIDNAHRQLHGALLDAEILAHVYLAMTGGQGSLFTLETEEEQQIITQAPQMPRFQNAELLVHYASAEEEGRHQEFVNFLIKKSGIDRFQ